MKKAILYIHGKGGSYTEAERYKKNCSGFEVVGVDYNDEVPWNVQNQLRSVYDEVRKEYDCVYVLANSIGAYFAMLALRNRKIEKALFISPVLDMEALISDMMKRAGVSEEELYEKGEIFLESGEVLSRKYLSFVRDNPIIWKFPTEILYAEKDELVSRQTIDRFIGSHQAKLTVMENGEHWFHTDEQLAFLDNWLKRAL